MNSECIRLRDTFQPQNKKHVHPHIWILLCNIHKYRSKQIYVWVQYNKKRREQERRMLDKEEGLAESY